MSETSPPLTLDDWVEGIKHAMREKSLTERLKLLESLRKRIDATLAVYAGLPQEQTLRSLVMQVREDLGGPAEGRVARRELMEWTGELFGQIAASHARITATCAADEFEQGNLAAGESLLAKASGLALVVPPQFFPVEEFHRAVLARQAAQPNDRPPRPPRPKPSG